MTTVPTAIFFAVGTFVFCYNRDRTNGRTVVLYRLFLAGMPDVVAAWLALERLGLAKQVERNIAERERRLIQRIVSPRVITRSQLMEMNARNRGRLRRAIRW